MLGRTKPGMSQYLSRKRDKPLRTYGRKATSTPEPRGEPPSKRARLEPDTQLEIKKSISTDSTQLPKEEESNLDKDTQPRPSTEAASRSSILQYFKPLTTDTKPQLQKEDERSNEKPIISQTVRTRRKPRLLRIRATSLPSDESEDAVSLSGRDDTDSNASSPDRKRKTLHDGGDNLLNQGRRESASSDAKPNVRTRSRRSPAVQTTLNISSKAAFAECKVCDTVWNPLYPDDVKYHEKRHKSVVRKARKVDDL